MRIAVTGSIATDHLMTFPGRFADSLVVDQLDKISLSFLVDDLEVRRGGRRREHRVRHGLPRSATRCWSARSARTSPTTGPGCERHGVDTGSVHVSELRHTARFVCTTDNDHARSRPSTPGAMTRGARHRARSRRRPGRRPRPRRRRRQRPRGDAAAHRGVPAPRLPVRRRPVAAARLDGRRRDPAARRRRDLPVHQRVRGGADRAEDRLVRRRDPLPGRHPGHHARRAGRPDRAQGRAAGAGPCAAGGAQGRPDRRRRRVPRRLPRRARVGPPARALRPGRLAARDVRHRDGRHAGVRARPARFLERFAEATAPTRRPTSQPHLRCPRP